VCGALTRALYVARCGTTAARPRRLRDDARKDKAVISHLEAENAHTKAVLADTEPLQVGAITRWWHSLNDR